MKKNKVGQQESEATQRRIEKKERIQIKEELVRNMQFMMKKGKLKNTESGRMIRILLSEIGKDKTKAK